jgi:hypothetical protein
VLDLLGSYSTLWQLYIEKSAFPLRSVNQELRRRRDLQIRISNAM